MWAAVALRGITEKMEVAAAQRVVVSLRAQQCSLVGYHLDGSFCSSMAAALARTCQPTCPKNGGIRGVHGHGKITLGGVNCSSPWSSSRACDLTLEQC